MQYLDKTIQNIIHLYNFFLNGYCGQHFFLTLQTFNVLTDEEFMKYFEICDTV